MQEDPTFGPLCRAPRYYIGEHVGAYRTVRKDVERNANGSMPGIRDKAARRLIRKAFLRSHSRLERSINNARALKAQAYEVAKDNKKSTGFARRLLAEELSIHQPVYCPEKPEIRKMRTAARKAKRRGAKHARPIDNAIDAVVEMGRKP